MKSVIATAIILITLFSCNKNRIAESEESKIKVENGILVFDNYETFSATLKTLNGLNDIEKSKWEKEKGFVSFRTIFGEVNEKLQSVSAKEEFDRLVVKAKDIFVVENDELIPCVNNFFSPIVNQEGIVRINKDYYRFFKDFETVVLNGSVEEVKNASETRIENSDAGIYSRKINREITSGNPNRFTCTPGVLSECMSSNGSNRRGYHKLEFSYYFGIERDPVTLLPIFNVEENSILLHFSAQKKVLFGWAEYATGYLCKTLEYSDYDNSGSTNISTANLSSDGEFKHWYYSLNFKRYKTPYGQPFTTHTCTPEITLFNCRATTRGTDPNDCLFTW